MATVQSDQGLAGQKAEARRCAPVMDFRDLAAARAAGAPNSPACAAPSPTSWEDGLDRAGRREQAKHESAQFPGPRCPPECRPIS